jgi:hypothetical protein
MLILFPLMLFAHDSARSGTGSPPWAEGLLSAVPQVLVCTTKIYARPDTPMQCFQTGASYTSTLSEIAGYFRLVQIVKDGRRVYYYFEKK